MSFLDDSTSALLPDPNVCPQCWAAGLSSCSHVGQRSAPKPVAQRTEFGPAASATLLKAGLLGAIAAIGFFAWRTAKSANSESGGETSQESSFEDWEPNQ